MQEAHIGQMIRDAQFFASFREHSGAFDMKRGFFFSLVVVCAVFGSTMPGQQHSLKALSTTRKPSFLAIFWSPASSASSGIRTHDFECSSPSAIHQPLFSLVLLERAKSLFRKVMGKKWDWGGRLFCLIGWSSLKCSFYVNTSGWCITEKLECSTISNGGHEFESRSLNLKPETKLSWGTGVFLFTERVLRLYRGHRHFWASDAQPAQATKLA